MIWVVFIVVALAVLGLFAGMVAGRIGYDPLSEPVASLPATGLPDRPDADDITGVRFDTALRGYRMDQVDDVLDRLQQRLDERERELADRERALALLRGGRGERESDQAPAQAPDVHADPGTDAGPDSGTDPGADPGADSGLDPDPARSAAPRPQG